jgi:hypothetical protein
MSDSPIPRADVVRTDPIQCPFCEETTMPNPLPDGSVVCSCTAERALPMGKEAGSPQPADDPGFAPSGDPEQRPGPLPEDKGQFGRDVATEDFEPLAPPPAGSGRTG